MTVPDPSSFPPGALAGLRVLDLSRIMAGPSATQILGDLGADVVKVERPGVGDDTRKWGPPYLEDGDGNPTTESAYYLSANRNKRSIALDFTQQADRETVMALVAKADILVENYRVGTLAKYGLDYPSLAEKHPGLIYCSITGFGQTGPYAGRAGYDFLIQAMGGIMSITGEPEGEPMKVGTAIADLMTGTYATIAILAAVNHRHATGLGQHIDMALLDTQVAWLANAAQYFLTSGVAPARLGNGHPVIVPYQAFQAADGYLILAVGNDGQFAKFCAVAGRQDLAEDPRFQRNTDRVVNRAVLIPILEEVIAAKPRDWWMAELDTAGVPVGPINRIDEVFDDRQVQARGLTGEVAHPLAADAIRLLTSPIKMSRTPPTVRRAPPVADADRQSVLADWLG